MVRPMIAPDADAIALLAETAMARIPAELRKHLGEVAIAIEELADDETLEGLGIDSPYDLTGLYRGTPRHLRGANDGGRLPDLIVLYRQAILLEWIETGEELGRLVGSVLIHEAAHHFGFSDAEIEALEAAP